MRLRSPVTIPYPIEATARLRFEQKVIRFGKVDCWLWFGNRQGHGYGIFFLDGRRYLAHRIAWAIFRGPVPVDRVVIHCCDTPLCVNPNHLRLGTQAENIADAHAKGRLPLSPMCDRKGEANHEAKLTEFAVTEIRRRYRRYSHTDNLRTLAAEFGVGLTTISDVVRNRRWKEVSRCA